MRLLDRDLQRELLHRMAEAYPEPCQGIRDRRAPHSPEMVNTHYLVELGLARFEENTVIDAPVRTTFQKNGVFITAKGLDFLHDDGGLSAILNTVTVRLHADTIRDLVETKILSSDAPEPEKQRLIDSLRKLPEEGLKTLTSRLINEGLSNAPGAWHALTQMLS